MGGALGGPTETGRPPPLTADPSQGVPLTWTWVREPGGLCCLPDTCTIREACGGAPPRELYDVSRFLREPRLQQEPLPDCPQQQRAVLGAVRGRRLAMRVSDGDTWGYWRSEGFDDAKDPTEPPSAEWAWVELPLVADARRGRDVSVEGGREVRALFRLRKEPFRRRSTVDMLALRPADGGEEWYYQPLPLP
eukprot:TRINITY_DN67273_c0_g1_i1.p1 TRINITY_DN67273_c0_g1~~TRINITY_DN67273_c0_g1_i1.p1  ORF type:complete len:215 (+),score=65.53 TRINITY_DN67273_c0_g1_i1:71-646(+)